MTRKSFFKSLAVLAASPAIIVRALAEKPSRPPPWYHEGTEDDVRSGFKKMTGVDPFALPPDVERKLRAEYEKHPPCNFTRDEILAMIERGDDVSKATNGHWTCMSRGWSAPTYLEYRPS